MRILILRLSSLGDIALLSPVFGEIKRAYPDCQVSCLVKEAYAGLLKTNPFVDEVIVFEGFWPTLRVLRSKTWDAVLDLHGVLRTRLFSLLVPARMKAAYRKDVLGRWAMVFGKKGNGHPPLRSYGMAKDGQLPCHVADRYRKALIPLGIGIKRAVVFQTAFLGDAILTLPLLRKLRDDFQPEFLAVISRPEHQNLFAQEGFSVIADDKRGRDRGLSGFLRIRRLLREGRFDAAFIPHRSLRSALLAWTSGVALRVGFKNSAGRFFLNRTVPFDWKTHDSERNLRLLEFLPRPIGPAAGSDGGFSIAVKAENRRKASDIWQGLGVNPGREFLVGMVPGSKWATKRWLKERFGELALSLREKHPASRIVLIGGPEDQALCGEIAGSIGDKTVNLAGRIGLQDLAALIADLRLFVTNDSGPMHLAYGLGVPTVAIFGPTVAGFGFYPKGPSSRVAEASGLACRPCSLHGGKRCPRRHFLCMRLVTTDRVLEACEEALKHESAHVRMCASAQV